MATAADQQATQPFYHLHIGPERTLVLPEALLRQLGIEPGDALIVSVRAGYGVLHKARADSWDGSADGGAVPEIEGMLADYFTDHEDVLRFIEDERGGSSG